MIGIQRIIHFWLMLGLILTLLASCKQDRNEPKPIEQGRSEAMTLSLNAEVSVDDSEIRATDYKLGKNTNGKTVPMPQFRDGQLIDVHTILKSSNNVSVAKTLKWRYDELSKKLILSSADGHNIEVANFNNDNGVKWYISGLIGGTLNTDTKTVAFEGTRELTGVEGSEGDFVGSLEVPYAFGWTELNIDTSSARDVEESHKVAQVSAGANLKFTPMGSLIAYKLGNQQTGAYTFKPSGFSVSTNAFGDQGTFDLDTNLPGNNAQSVLPTWVEASDSVTISYSFANNQAPGAIANKQTASKTYYAWVMPHTTQPNAVSTHVMMTGETNRISSKPLEIWATDYKVKLSKLEQGKVYALRANVTTGRPLLPIDYVTDYNLAGGEEWTYTTTNINPQPAGVLGSLRFATSHNNDQSGYYNWYHVVGRNESTHNPNGLRLLDAVDAKWGKDKYVVPVADQWWGVHPSRFFYRFNTDTVTLNVDEVMAFGSDDNLLRQSYKSDYSQGFSDNMATSDAVVYAIRFKERQVADPVRFSADYDPIAKAGKVYTYPSSPDSFFKCAYRYTRVEGHDAWLLSRPSVIHPNPSLVNANLTSHFVIDVVYLGEEAVPTTLNQISNPQWWDDKKAKGLVISKTLPTAGVLKLDGQNFDQAGTLIDRGGWNSYWSSSQRRVLLGGAYIWTPSVSQAAIHGYSEWPTQKHSTFGFPYCLPVRLFYKDPRSN